MFKSLRWFKGLKVKPRQFPKGEAGRRFHLYAFFTKNFLPSCFNPLNLVGERIGDGGFK